MRTRSVVVLVAAALSSACAPTPTVADATLTVLAAETFLADIAQNVAGDRLQVASILPPGIDPHEFQARPQDAARVAQASVLIVNGRGYEAWLENLLQAGGSAHLEVEASAGLTAGQNDDPHLWMNPRNVTRYVENIRDGLSKADPDGRSEYAANAEAYIAELHELDAWITAEVSGLPGERRVLITNHHALESFAEAYDFRIAGVIIPGYSSGAATSAQGITNLIGTIRELEAPAIFLDVSENPDLARQVAAESGVQVVTGLYVETLSEPDGPAPTYIAMMRHNVGLIVSALR